MNKKLYSNFLLYSPIGKLESFLLITRSRELSAEDYSDGDDFDEDDDDDGDELDEGDEDEHRSVTRSFELLTIPRVPFVEFYSSVMVRRAYIEIFKDVILKHHHTLVSGNPGVGKSLFMWYVLYKLSEGANEEMVFILGFSKLSSYMIVRNDFVYYCCNEMEALEESVEAEREKKKIYYLFDCATKGNMRPLSAIAARSILSVVFSSPDQENHHDYLKDCVTSATQKGVRVIMPTWSLCEINDYLSTGNVTVEREVVLSRLALFGGIPRYLFECGNGITSKNNLESAILFAKHEEILKLVNHYKNGTISNKYSNKVVQIVPIKGSNYEEYFVDFTSMYVRCQIVKHSMEHDRENFLKVLNTKSPDIAVIRGHYFESFAHYKLAKGGNFSVKCLEDEDECTEYFSIVPNERFEFDCYHENFEESVYYVPESKTYESVDSLFPPKSVFQMTVSKKHSIRVGGLKTVRKFLKQTPINFFFVVPEDIFECFPYQKYINKDKRQSKDKVINHFKQWVMSVPCNF